MTMLAISQKPERVSNILRSSTPMIRVIGIGGCGVTERATRAGTVGVGVAVAVAVMPLLLPEWCG